MWHGSVIARGLNLRPAPGTSNTPLLVLPTGTRFEVLDGDAAPGWFRVWAGSPNVGREGFLCADAAYVRSERTAEADLVAVATPSPTARPVLLHRRAAAAFERVLTSLSSADARALCSAVTSSFRPWAGQEAMIRSYEAAIGSKWTQWSALTDAQEAAARKAGFAYHPGYPVDASHTHVGGGALDLRAPLPAAVSAALGAQAFRLDTPGDVVHWAWHG